MIAFEVVGSHAVTAIDGSHPDYSNVSELKPDEILVQKCNARVTSWL